MPFGAEIGPRPDRNRVGQLILQVTTSWAVESRRRRECAKPPNCRMGRRSMSGTHRAGIRRSPTTGCGRGCDVSGRASLGCHVTTSVLRANHPSPRKTQSGRRRPAATTIGPEESSILSPMSFSSASGDMDRSFLSRCADPRTMAAIFQRQYDDWHNLGNRQFAVSSIERGT